MCTGFKLAQNRNSLRASVYMVINVRFHKKWEFDLLRHYTFLKKNSVTWTSLMKSVIWAKYSIAGSHRNCYSCVPLVSAPLWCS